MEEKILKTSPKRLEQQRVAQSKVRESAKSEGKTRLDMYIDGDVNSYLMAIKVNYGFSSKTEAIEEMIKSIYFGEILKKRI